MGAEEGGAARSSFLPPPPTTKLRPGPEAWLRSGKDFICIRRPRAWHAAASGRGLGRVGRPPFGSTPPSQRPKEALVGGQGGRKCVTPPPPWQGRARRMRRVCGAVRACPPPPRGLAGVYVCTQMLCSFEMNSAFLVVLRASWLLSWGERGESCCHVPSPAPRDFQMCRGLPGRTPCNPRTSTSRTITASGGRRHGVAPASGGRPVAPAPRQLWSVPTAAFGELRGPSRWAPPRRRAVVVGRGPGRAPPPTLHMSRLDPRGGRRVLRRRVWSTRGRPGATPPPQCSLRRAEARVGGRSKGEGAPTSETGSAHREGGRDRSQKGTWGGGGSPQDMARDDFSEAPRRADSRNPIFIFCRILGLGHLRGAVN